MIAPKNPMEKPGVPRQLCEIKAKILELRAKIKKKIEDTENKILKILTKIAEIRWGLLRITADELLTAISGIAAMIVASALQALASALAASVGALIASFLRILTENIDAIYAIAGIPHEKALEHATEERMELDIVISNIGTIRAITSKWKSLTAPPEYLAAIKKTIPLVERVIENLNTVSEGLSDTINATFYNSEYDSALVALKEAIEASNPETSIERILGPEEAIEDKTAELLADSVSDIKSKYNAMRKEESVKYQEKMAEFRSSVDKSINKEGKTTISNVADNNAAKVEYEYNIAKIDTKEKSDIAKANIKAQGDATYDYIKNGLGDAIRSKAKEFSDDMLIILKAINNIRKASSSATGHHYACQMSSNVLVTFEEKIRNIMSLLIGLMTQSGNIAAKPVRISVDNAIAMSEVALDLLNEGIEDIDKSRSPWPSLSSVKLAGANQMLSGADDLLAATVIDRMIELINSDDRESQMNKSFTEFVERLDAIPDFSGKPGIWAKNPLQSSTPPHRMITSAAVKMAASATLSKNKSTSEIKSGTRDILELVGSAKKHNSSVISALNSWRPPKSDKVKEIKAILISLGLLEAFAITGSLMHLLSELGAFGDMEFNKCEVNYPELFASKDVKTELYLSQINRKYDQNETTSRQLKKLKKHAQTVAEVNSGKKKLAKTDDKDMANLT